MIKAELEFLFDELGSEEKVFTLMEEFYQAMALDVMIGFFFANKDLKAISQRQAEFLLRAMGVRKTYSGQPPSQAHRHLAPILSGHFDRRAQILKDFLISKNLSSRAITAWVSFEEAFREAVASKL